MNPLSPNLIRLPFQSWAASSECAVQTNGLYSPPGLGPGLTQPPAAWFTSLHRPHYRNGLAGGQRGGYQLQVYDLDTPMTRPTEFAPPRTSTPLESKSVQGNGHSHRVSGHKVRNQQTEGSQHWSHLPVRDRDSPNNKNRFSENKVSGRSLGGGEGRSLSSDNILDAEPAHCPAHCPAPRAPGEQITQKEQLRKTSIPSDYDFKRARLVKSASSDGMISSQQNSNIITQSESISADQQSPMRRRNPLEESLSKESLDNIESELPELALVVGTEVSGKRRHTLQKCIGYNNLKPNFFPEGDAGQNAFRTMGANGTFNSCEVDGGLSHQMCDLEKFNNPEVPQLAGRPNSQGKRLN